MKKAISFGAAIAVSASMCLAPLSYADEPDTQAINTAAIGTDGFTDFKGEAGFVNVRSEAIQDSAAVGKLFNHSVVHIEDADEYGWYKIKSGDVEGYVASQYVATGEDANAIAANAGYTTVKVSPEYLNVRADMDEASEAVDMTKQGDELEVIENDGDWIKVVTDDNVYGYVSANYVYDLKTEYKTAVANDEAYVSNYGNDAGDGSYSENTDTPSETYVEPAQTAETTAQAETTPETAAQNDNGDGRADASQETAAAHDYVLPETTAETSAQAETTAETAAQPQTDAQPAETTAPETQAQETSGYNISDEEKAYLATLPQDVQNLFYASIDAGNNGDAAKAADLYNQYMAAVNGTSGTQQETQAQTQAETQPETQPQTQAETQAPETQAQTSAAPAASSTGQAVADFACQFVGNPYVWGGTSLTGGADCSGFTMSVYANFGISLPHSAAAQSGYGTRVSLDSLAPGDLLFYDHGTGSIEHVGIYIGGGSIVHASNSKSGIKISGAFYSSPVCAVRLV